MDKDDNKITNIKFINHIVDLFNSKNEVTILLNNGLRLVGNIININDVTLLLCTSGTQIKGNIHHLIFLSSITSILY